MSVLKNIQHIWLNRRTTKLGPFILAVEAFSDAILRSYSNSTDFCTRKYRRNLTRMGLQYAKGFDTQEASLVTGRWD